MLSDRVFGRVRGICRPVWLASGWPMASDSVLQEVNRGLRSLAPPNSGSLLGTKSCDYGFGI